MDALLLISCIPVCLILYLLYRILLVKVNVERDANKRSASIMIVVGSGGHTREVLCLARELGSQYSPRYYIVADTDRMSEVKVHEMEASRKNNDVHSQYFIIKIPRSREVKQSWLSTVLSTLYASVYTLPVVFKRKPKIILCNGPGTCIPVCFAGLILKWLNYQHTVIMYVESVCRVTSLSMSAKILYNFTDYMFVQWPELQKKYPKCRYIGRIV